MIPGSRMTERSSAGRVQLPAPLSSRVRCARRSQNSFAVHGFPAAAGRRSWLGRKLPRWVLPWLSTPSPKAGKYFGDQFFDFAAFRIQEDDLLAHESHIAHALENAGLVQFGIHLLQKGNFVGQGHFKGVDLARAGKLGLDGIFLSQAHREGDPLGGYPGIVEGFIEQTRPGRSVSEEAENPQAPWYNTRTPTPLSREAAGVFQVAVPHRQGVGFLGPDTSAHPHRWAPFPFESFDLLL
jgi:hypothetical protein